jgi:hypothetical protein
MSSMAESIEIHATSRTQRDTLLNAAVQELQQVAQQTGRHGILVTRHQPGRYIAVLSDKVPYGVTLERFV